MRILVVGLVCIACGGSPQAPRQEPLSSRWTAPAMLAQVPADSPYLIAMLQPLPEAVSQRMFDSSDKKIAKAFEASRGADRSQLEPVQRAWYAVLDQLEGKDLRHWGRELGFEPNGRFVIYGLSVWPVLRVSVADEARVRQVFLRAVAAAGVPATPKQLRRREYWQIESGTVSVIASVGDRQAILTVLPTAAIAQYLPLALGLDQPARSLQDSRSLDALIGRYRFLPTTIGYVDARLVADIVTGRATTSNSELDKPLRTAIGPLTDACRAEADLLASFVPRIVMGYRRLDRTGMHMSLALELAPHIAAALERVRTAVPDLPQGIGTRSLLHIGVAADLDALLPLVLQLTTYVREHPFQCELFASLGEAAAELATLLDRPLPPPLYGVRGMALVLDDATAEPFNPRGHAVLVGDHAHDLLALVLQSLPGMSGTVVRPDARPVQLPLANLGAPAAVVGYAATRIDRAAISIGPASASDVVEVLNRAPPKRSPLFSIGFDVERMAKIGWLEPEDTTGMRDVVMQLDVAPEGLVLEMYGTLVPR